MQFLSSLRCSLFVCNIIIFIPNLSFYFFNSVVIRISSCLCCWYYWNSYSYRTTCTSSYDCHYRSK
uniref:Uncharacterized protein n=1 Tax=uncultured marine virus TaxID=186617 RepID=A0A0F7L868_9VIRU|nr:hypothetical protein [uncultured marine virus]